MELKALTPEEIHEIVIKPFKTALCLKKNIIKSQYLVGGSRFSGYDKDRDWRGELGN